MKVPVACIYLEYFGFCSVLAFVGGYSDVFISFRLFGVGFGLNFRLFWIACK